MASYYQPVKSYQGPTQPGVNEVSFRKTGINIGKTPDYVTQDAYMQTNDKIRSGEMKDYYSPTAGGYLAYQDTGNGMWEPIYTATPQGGKVLSKDKVSIPSGGYDAFSMLKNAGIDPSKKKSLFKQYGVDNTPDLLKAMQKSAKSRQSDYEKKVRGSINEGYNDVFSQLDSMIGLLPSQKAELEARINEMAAGQTADVELEKERGLASLLNSEQKQRQLAASSLRDLDEDTRSAMVAAGRYIGAAGAGDSSASYLASEALARQAQKSRAGVLSTRDQAINEIELKKSDVESLATQEKSKVGQWKSSALADITSTFQSRMENLMNAKVNATAEKANAISNLIQDSYKSFMTQLANLDNQALQYVQQIDMWQMQRAGELEDYASRLGIAKSYQGPDQDAYTNRVLSLYGQGLTLDAANEIAKGEGLSGSMITSDMLTGDTSPSDISNNNQYIYQESQQPPSEFDWSSANLG